jgi:hypothetical protein
VVSISFASKIIPMGFLTLGEKKFVDLIYTKLTFVLNMARLNMWVCHLASPVLQTLIKDVSQYMGYMKIVYRKESENGSDALGRREDLADLTEESIIDNPILKQKFEDYDARIFEKELEDLRESLMETTHLQCDDQVIKDICDGYL